MDLSITEAPQSTTNNPESKPEDPQLKFLFDYTVFHIGIYITLTTAILAAFEYGTGTDRLLLMPILCFVGAGACGGVIGSSIPHQSGFNQFIKGKWIGIGYKSWIRLQHACFWFGVVALIAVVFNQQPNSTQNVDTLTDKTDNKASP